MVAAELLLLAAAAHVQRMQLSDVAHQMRQRRRRLLLMDLAFHWQTPLTTRPYTKVERSPNGWMSSTMYGYVFGKDGVRNSDDVFRANFRMGAGTFDLLCERLRGNAAYKFAHDSYVRRESGEKIRGKKPVRYEFRIATCLYLFAHGGNLKPVADVASVSKRTLRKWLQQFCAAVVNELEPEYMPFKPPCTSAGCDHTSATCNLARINRKFGARHGFPNVAAAVDGTHVKVNFGDPAYRNYKGWESILCVCFVSPFYTFTYADVGWSGKNGDTTVLKFSKYMDAVSENPELWIGKGGVILADGGCYDDGAGVFMNPYHNPSTPEEYHFNFCHSSTRFFVEETFGRWKNRFRFLIKPCDTKHRLTTQMIYASMILHNFITVNGNQGRAFSSQQVLSRTDVELWSQFYTDNAPDACPACVRRNAKHCVHRSQYQDEVLRGRHRANRQQRTVLAQRDRLKDKFWARMEARLHGTHSLVDSDDDADNNEDRVTDDALARVADLANLAELHAARALDDDHYQLMQNRAIVGYAAR